MRPYVIHVVGNIIQVLTQDIEIYTNLEIIELHLFNHKAFKNEHKSVILPLQY